jgi:cardiolipin synthase
MFLEGRSTYGHLFEDISYARDHIHVEHFIIRNDDIGRQFLELLTRKAREGVAVRLMFVDVGSRPSELMLQELERAGGSYARFFPSPVPWLRWLNHNINYRNHRKIVVIDGRISYTGGFNIGDEYLGKDPELGHWRDTHLRIDGPATLALQMRFILDWNFASKERVDPSTRFFPPVVGGEGVAMQIVSSGPLLRQDQIKEAYLKMIATAKRSILIQTPYFVPDQSVMDLLRIAALSGVEVRIMVPRRKDQLLVHWASASYLGELLEAGVKVYYYEDGFIHSKTIAVDGLIVSIGSANWDIRGFELNFETNAVVYDREFVEEHVLAFERDLQSCTQLTKEAYEQRGIGPRIKESLARLASPVL